MVKTIEPGYVYRIDRNDFTRVINGWRDLGQFSTYVSVISGQQSMGFAFSSDYNEKFGGPSDRKHPGVTRDQRFAMSKYYQGFICKYSLDGEFLEKVSMRDFYIMGGKHYGIGIFKTLKGVPELKGKDIQVLIPQAGFFWDFEELPSIETVIMSDETKFDIGEELYETLRTGQILIDDPHAIKRAYNTRSPEAHERKVARQLQEDALKKDGANRSGNRRGMHGNHKTGHRFEK